MATYKMSDEEIYCLSIVKRMLYNIYEESRCGSKLSDLVTEIDDDLYILRTQYLDDWELE